MDLPLSSTTSAAPSLNFILVSEKRNKNNHQMWCAQVLLVLWGAQLANYISPTAQPPVPFLPPPKGDDKKDTPPMPYPQFEVWIAKD